MKYNENKNNFCFFKMSTKERIKRFSKKTLDKCLPYIKLKDFTENVKINPDEANEYLTYGFHAYKLRNGQKVKVVIYNSDFQNTDIYFLESKISKMEILDLKLIVDLSFNIKECRNLNHKRKYSCFEKKKKSNSKKKIILFNNPHQSNISTTNNSSSLLNSTTVFYNPNINKCYVSLIKTAAKSIDLVFKSEHHLKLFAYALFSIYQHENSEEEDKPNLNVFERYLKKIWNKIDINGLQYLDLIEFTRMVKVLDKNYNCISLNMKDEKSIRDLFEKLDIDNSGKVYFDEFFKFYNEILAGSEFEEVFLKYSKGKQYLNFEDLSEFIITEQRELMNSDHIAEIFDKYKIQVPETTRTNEYTRYEL